MSWAYVVREARSGRWRYGLQVDSEDIVAAADGLERLDALAKIAQEVVAEAAREAQECCGEASGHRECDAFGCYNLVRLVEPLADALAALDKQATP